MFKTTVQSAVALPLQQLQHSSRSRERLGGESGEVRLCVFPSEDRCEVFSFHGNAGSHSPHMMGARLLQEDGAGNSCCCCWSACLIANAWWVFCDGRKGNAEREVQGCCVKVFSICVTMVTLLWYYGRVTLSSLQSLFI